MFYAPHLLHKHSEQPPPQLLPGGAQAEPNQQRSHAEEGRVFGAFAAKEGQTGAPAREAQKCGARGDAQPQ